MGEGPAICQSEVSANSEPHVRLSVMMGRESGSGRCGGRGGRTKRPTRARPPELHSRGLSSVPASPRVHFCAPCPGAPMSGKQTRVSELADTEVDRSDIPLLNNVQAVPEESGGAIRHSDGSLLPSWKMTPRRVLGVERRRFEALLPDNRRSPHANTDIRSGYSF